MTTNIDPAEIDKFNNLAHRWWDPNGDFKPLHDINPVRLAYIQAWADLSEGEVIDIGCGGGILTEAMAQTGAVVTGADMAEMALGIAKLHAHENNINITYETATAEHMASTRASSFNTVTCLEMLEHVTDYPSTVQACADLARPGGHLFFSTINRNPKAYLLLVLGAEYVMNILPRGTHEYAKFIRPAELCRAVRAAGLEVREIKGLTYNPFTRTGSISEDVSVNYLVYARKPNSFTT